jgi:hypothetical protein
VAKKNGEMIVLCLRLKCAGATSEVRERKRRTRTTYGEIWDKTACQPRK